MRELYKRIKELKESKGDGGIRGNEYRNEFFSHLKSWLASRFKTVNDSDLGRLQSSAKEFESDFSELESAVKEGDLEDVNFYTDSLEDQLNGCKEKYRLQR